jgi:hypothetical protein
VLAARARHGQSGLRQQPGLAGHMQAWLLLVGGNGGGDERLPQWAGVSGDGRAELLPVPVTKAEAPCSRPRRRQSRTLFGARECAAFRSTKQPIEPEGLLAVHPRRG